MGNRQPRLRAFEDYLLPVADAADPDGIGGETDPDRYVASRAALLYDRLQFVAIRAPRRATWTVRRSRRANSTRTKQMAPEAARPLAARLEGLLSRVRITEVLADVDAWTGFTDRFSHLRTGNPTVDKPALLAAILADGTNLGLSRMADASRGLTYHHLVNVARWHINDDNYVAARAEGVPLETRGVPATRDPVLGELTIWASGQWPHSASALTAALLGLEERHVRAMSAADSA